MKGFAQFYEKINVEFLNISEKYVLNKKRSPFGLCLKNGDAYGIRTRDTALRGLWLNRLPNAPCV